MNLIRLKLSRREDARQPSPKSEIQACRPWLDAELALVKPKILVCLGASAAQALVGRTFRVSRDRGKQVDSSLAPHVLATVHPSSILRAPDEESRRTQLRAFINDLHRVALAAGTNTISDQAETTNRAKRNLDLSGEPKTTRKSTRRVA
jgi:uracil-DNA glycosylase family 4